MSENVSEHPRSSDSAATSPPPPAAYGARPGSEHIETPAAGPGTSSSGPFYGPVNRPAHRSPDGQRADAPTQTPGWTQVAPSATAAWPPGPSAGALPSGAHPATYVSWGATAPSPGVGGPVPPWTAPVSWSPPPRDDYASWGRRVAGAAIDAVPGWVAAIVLTAGYLPTYLGLFRGDFAVPPSYGLMVVGTLLYVGAFGFAIYNRWFLAGRTGQTIGKRVTKTWLVSRTSGRPVGTLAAFLRDLLHVLDGLGYVGYLWPLWDDEHQTLADKVAQTIVVRTPAPPLSELERRPH